MAIVHPEKTCQGKITLFWAVKFSGDQAIKRAMKPAKMVGTAQPWRFHSGMGGGSTLNFKGSTPRAHCDPVENTSRHLKALWSWSSPILLVCFPMCLIKPILASQTPCLVFVEGDILSLLLLTLAFLQRLLEGKTFSYLLISQNISIISHTTILVGLDHQVWWVLNVVQFTIFHV